MLFSQRTDVLALVWSLVRHALRRHCLEAPYTIRNKLEMPTDGYDQGHANNELHEEYGRGEQKHFLEENWQKELALT